MKSRAKTKPEAVKEGEQEVARENTGPVEIGRRIEAVFPGGETWATICHLGRSAGLGFCRQLYAGKTQAWQAPFLRRLSTDLALLTGLSIQHILAATTGLLWGSSVS